VLGDDREGVAPMTRAAPSVVYVVPDKLGGMMNIIANLLAYRCRAQWRHHAILTRNSLDPDTWFARALDADTQTTIEYTLPIENLHAVMRRLARAVPPGEGVYVAGDLLDLATASVVDFGRAVIHMLHGDSEYYYGLAVSHDPIVHAFVAYSRRMYDTLVERLPHRADTIFHLPYGIPIPRPSARSTSGSLRLVFAGRFDERQKGIFDLPEIDRALVARGVSVQWTIAGAGPDGDELRRRWLFNPRVQWAGALSNAETIALYATQDVFVLPTRVEGFPVALLEAMSAGLVPVVSDIPSGVPEVVTSPDVGDRPPVGDVAAFADAIAALARDRSRLASMSAAARAAVAARFDVRDRVRDYEALYARYRELYRPLASAGRLQYGSRLDQSWIPNTVVRAVRTVQRRMKSR
jgi:glycosyltransferase involved in cell wall biosynthesis